MCRSIAVCVITWLLVVSVVAGELGTDGNVALAVTERVSTQGSDNRPNFVFIVTDDMQRSMFNALPEGRRKTLLERVKALAFSDVVGSENRNYTPSIDFLARQGVLMRGQYVASAVCTPSRYNVLTGRYASRSLATRPGEQSVVAWDTWIREQDRTLPKLLQENGYVTGFVGKNHVIFAEGLKTIALDADARDPQITNDLKENEAKIRAAVQAVGFDYAEGIYHVNPNDVRPRELRVHNLDWLAEAGMEFIDRYGNEPFFLYFATTVPHSPGGKERAWGADSTATPYGYLDRPPNVLPPRSGLPDRLEAAGVDPGGSRENLLWLDDAIGALIDKLRDKGVLSRTIIVLFNDHGQSAKGTLYEGGANNPSIIWREGGFPGGSETNALISNVDFAPTVLDLAGIAAAPDMFDGKSFRDLLFGLSYQVHRSLFFEMGYTRAVRRGRFKYLALRYPDSIQNMSLEERRLRLEAFNRKRKHQFTEEPSAPFSHLTAIPGGGAAEYKSTGVNPAYYDKDQLFDLQEDPDELVNLAGDPAYTLVLREMKTELQAYLNDLPGSFGELASKSGVGVQTNFKGVTE